MTKRNSGEKAQETGTGTGKAKSCDAEKPPLAAALPVRSIPPKVPQRHGGALYAGGVPGNRGGGMAQERRERIEAIKEALTGHVEQLSGMVSRLLEAAEGEQYRCPRCGSFGPKVPTVGLREAADVLKQLGAIILPAQHEHEGLPPIQVNVVAGVQVVPYRPDEE